MPYTPGLGIPVVRATEVFGVAGTYPIFTIADGPILLTALVGIVTFAMDATTPTTLSFQHSVGNTAISGALADIASDGIGTIYTITGVFVDLALKAELGASGAVAAGLMSNGITLIPGTIDYINGNTQTGLVQWTVWYIPLIDAANIVVV